MDKINLLFLNAVFSDVIFRLVYDYCILFYIFFCTLFYQLNKTVNEIFT